MESSPAIVSSSAPLDPLSESLPRSLLWGEWACVCVLRDLTLLFKPCGCHGTGCLIRLVESKSTEWAAATHTRAHTHIYRKNAWLPVSPLTPGQPGSKGELTPTLPRDKEGGLRSTQMSAWHSHSCSPLHSNPKEFLQLCWPNNNQEGLLLLSSLSNVIWYASSSSLHLLHTLTGLCGGLAAVC